MTIRDIAELAHVSVSTVSRSLNGSALVAGRTRERILEIAREVGFEFNASARGLSTNQVGTIGIILPDDYDRLHVHFYHSGFHNYLRRTLEREDLDLIVAFSRNRFNGGNAVQKLVRRKKVDGLILVLPSLDRETEEFLCERRVPYVFSHYPPENERRESDRVYVDHEKGGMLVGRLFARKSFRHVVVFRHRDRLLEFEQRLDGFRLGFSAVLAGSPAVTEPRASGAAESICELESCSSFEDGFALASESSGGLGDADAVFALNDLMAFGIVQGLRARGLSVPDDVAVVGYDDTPLTPLLRPRLTTVRQPAEEVTFMTVERLIGAIDDYRNGRPHRPRRIALEPQLVIRETCGE